MLHQGDAGVADRVAGGIAGHGHIEEVSHRPRGLHAGGTAAHDHHVHHLGSFGRRRLHSGLELFEHMVLEPDRVVQRVQRERMLISTWGPEEVGASSQTHHEVVVGLILPVLEGDIAGGDVDAAHLRGDEAEVGLVVDVLADRVADGLGIEDVGRHLVQQRLERVVVVAVHQHHVDRGLRQLPGGSQACEACPEDQHFGHGCHSANLSAVNRIPGRNRSGIATV